MSVAIPGGGARSSAVSQRLMEHIKREGCEVNCDWRKLAASQGIDTSEFTYEKCTEIREELDLKGLARCGMAGISVCIAGQDGMFS